MVLGFNAAADLAATGPCRHKGARIPVRLVGNNQIWLWSVELLHGQVQQ